jgi:hypothetical protein
MTKPSVIPAGSWPALLRDEYAAAYVGEKTVETFLLRVGKDWPKPWRERGTGKGKYRVWRKIDLDRIINPNFADPDLEAW